MQTFRCSIVLGDMEHARLIATAFSLLLLHSATPSAADAAESPLRHGVPAPKVDSASREIEFRYDDAEGQRIARKLLAKELAQEERDTSEAPALRTAWVKMSPAQRPALFVLYGCSPTGNCGLYGFEPSNRGWRQILDSIAQTCAVLPSSHGGRRDLSARMHGSATESTIKTYWWRKNRYVRVSVQEITFPR